MARRFKQTSFRFGRAKRKTKWCAATSTITIPSTGNITTNDATALCPSSASDVDNPDPTVGWCKGSISLSRANSVDSQPAVAWAIVMGRTNPGTTSPIQIFNPFAEDDLERQDILGMGYIACDPIILNSADAVTIQRSATVADINIRVGRKYARHSNGLFLWVVSVGTDDTWAATFSIRSLMKF